MLLAALTDRQVSYYSTIAQVLPVLLLALAFEVRYASWLSPATKRWRVAFTLALVSAPVSLFALGESFAVEALRSDRISDFNDAVISVTFNVLTLYLAVGLSCLASLELRRGRDGREA